MYQAQKALFLYCVTPVHMGAGTAIGLIDNPIQRERHTDYPLFAGSGLKGAVRHRFVADGWDRVTVQRIFGPEGSDYAGAISLGDAQLVAFPVRCTRRAYVYATSPTALARVKRQLEHLEVKVPWAVPEVQEGHCNIVPGSSLANEGEALDLEVFQHTANPAEDMRTIAEWIAEHAFPKDESCSYFRNKLKTDLVLLPNEDFSHYVKNATVVEPHVRIDDDTGTAAKTGLFYTENLPPESLLVAPLMASKTRDKGDEIQARDVLQKVLVGENKKIGLDGLLLQVGGDATTGRGQVVVSAVVEDAS